MTFPLTEGLEYPEFKGLDHRGIRNQPALPTVSPHLPQDALNKAHWKFFPPAVHIRSRKNAALEATKVESRERERERDLNTQFGTKMATRPNSWNLSLDSELIKTAQKSRATTPNRSFLFPPTSFTMVGPSQLRLGSSVMAQRFRRRSMAFISWSCRITKRRSNHPLKHVWTNFLLRGWEVNVLSWYPIWNRRILVATSQHTGEGIWHSRFSIFLVGRV